ncbi:MAG: MFS transporter [Eubacteriales bacterium]|nr:MFS transporter [Eubacteriales bacterium]NCC76877.1 MFS transporter [Clostridia bacterium]
MAEISVLQPAGTLRLWTPAFSIITLISFLIGLVQLSLSTNLPLYVVGAYDSTSSAGAMVGAFALAAMLGRPFAGQIIDRLSKPGLYLAGTALFTAGVAMLLYQGSLVWLIAARIVQGLGFSLVSTVAGAMIADVLHPQRLGSGIAIYTVTGSLANALGPVAGLTIAQSFGYPVFFKTILVTSVLTVVIIPALFGRQTGSRHIASEHDTESLPIDLHQADASKSSRQRKISSLIEPTAVAPASVMLFLAITYGALLGFMPILAQTKNLGSAGTYFAIQSGAVLAVRLVMPALVSRLSTLRLVRLAIGLLIPALAILIASCHPILFYSSAVLYGAGFGLAFPLMNTVVFKRCPPQARGRANATFYLALDLGIGAGTILLGYMAKWLQLEAVFVTALVVAILAFLVAPRLLKTVR